MCSWYTALSFHYATLAGAQDTNPLDYRTVHRIQNCIITLKTKRDIYNLKIRIMSMNNEYVVTVVRHSL